MKVTKLQAENVQNYLASLGHEISRLQALEIIALGQGKSSKQSTLEPTTDGWIIGGDVVPNVTSSSVFHNLIHARVGMMLQYKYHNTDQYPDYASAAWHANRHLNDTGLHYWDWVSARIKQSKSKEFQEMFAHAIKDICRTNGLNLEDFKAVVALLVKECPVLFQTEDFAMIFLMGATGECSRD